MRNFLGLVLLSCSVPVLAQDACAGSRDLRVVNARIHTMDAKDTVLSEIAIQDGKFSTSTKLSPCTKTVNLHGRTVVPGLIDNHNHIVLFGMRPGRDVRIETATSIAEVQAILRDRAKTLPPGAFITTLGDWNAKQFAEKRAPTLEELDQALPNNPYIMNGSGTITNTLGKKFFESKGVTVNPNGTITGQQFTAALHALRDIQTFDDMKQGTTYAMQYLVSFGLTTSADMGAFTIPGTPDMQGAAVSDGVESLNPWTMYDAFMALHREGKMIERLRIYYLSQDTAPDVPILKERMLNAFPGFGDDMLRSTGIGEFAAAWRFQGRGRGAQGPGPANYETALQMVAKHGWAFQQHTLSLNEDQFTTSTFEKVNAITPIGDLRWSIAHVPKIDLPTLLRLKAIGAGVAVHGWLYLSGTPNNGGPPYRTIVDSGIHVGAGSDAAAVSVFDPWLEIYYMVTGKNAAGELINDKQQLTRQEAIRLYTANNGWFLHEEDKLGTIEPGKLADLAVLNEDYFDAKKVSDEGIKKLKSVLTVVGGQVVYDQLPK
jgi:predicted amidohydrolase YtcJ